MALEAFVWLIGSAVGAGLTAVLMVYGLRQLGDADRGHRRAWLIGTIAGVVAGAAAVRACVQAGTWWVAPAFVVWACALAAAGVCDAMTQRVPTALVRPAGVVTAVLFAAGYSVHRDWGGLALSGVAAVASGLVILLCWRFAGAGFGDVRLAAFGGLGLGHVTQRGLVVGFIAFIVLTLVQAGVTLARGGDRDTTFPYGPALATGFLLAATL